MTYEEKSFQMVNEAEKSRTISATLMYVFMTRAIVYALNNIAAAIREGRAS